MPSYEFTCIVCNEITAVNASIHDDVAAPMHCGEFMNKMWYAAPVKFNASGFYSTGG